MNVVYKLRFKQIKSSLIFSFNPSIGKSFELKDILDEVLLTEKEHELKRKLILNEI